MSKKIRMIAIIALLGVAAGCVGIWLIMRNLPVENPIAEILVDSEVIRRVPLSENCLFTVKTENGYNVISVEDGHIRVAESNCPDHVCVHTGAISGGKVPIVCLPHRLEVRIVSSKGNIDAGL